MIVGRPPGRPPHFVGPPVGRPRRFRAAAAQTPPPFPYAPTVPPFTIVGRDGPARAGLLRTAHGEVRTPAFVPLASTATVKTLHAAEVAELGYEMVLGNAFHLFIQPGAELIGELGGLHEFMGWDGAIITDSGGFQVFSMGYGSVAEEIKRRRDPRESMVLEIGEDGVRFRSYLDGSERFMGPETSMEVQAALGSDIALAFDECTPFHVERDYTERSMERTHRWLDRCVAWQREHGPAGQLLFGIVQGGIHRDLRARATAYVASADVDGIAIGGSLGQEKRQMREVVGWVLRDVPDDPPRHLLGIGDVDDLIHAVGAGVDTFDCATPTRLARHGTALISDPQKRWRLDLNRRAHRADPEPIDESCPCPACREHTRAYLHYLVRAGELTGKRLLTLHNLTFMRRLMRGMQEAIAAGEYEAFARGVLEGDVSARAAG
jgi:queuine tRNA-ribosyltransferase